MKTGEKSSKIEILDVSYSIISVFLVFRSSEFLSRSRSTWYSVTKNSSIAFQTTYSFIFIYKMETEGELDISSNQKPINNLKPGPGFPNTPAAQNNYNKGLSQPIQNNSFFGGPGQAINKQGVGLGANKPPGNGPSFQGQNLNTGLSKNFNQGFPKPSENPSKNEGFPQGVPGTGIIMKQNAELAPEPKNFPIIAASNQRGGHKQGSGPSSNQPPRLGPQNMPKLNGSGIGGGGREPSPSAPPNLVKHEAVPGGPTSQIKQNFEPFNSGLPGNQVPPNTQIKNEGNSRAFNFQQGPGNNQVRPGLDPRGQGNPAGSMFVPGQGNKPGFNPLPQSSANHQLNPQIKPELNAPFVAAPVLNQSPPFIPNNNQSKPASAVPLQDKPGNGIPPPLLNQPTDKSRFENPRSSQISGQKLPINTTGPVNIIKPDSRPPPQQAVNPPKPAQIRPESPSRQNGPGPVLINKQATPKNQIPIPFEIPKDNLQFTLKKYHAEEILTKLDIISTNLVEVLDMNLILGNYQEVLLKLTQLSQKGSANAKKILELIQIRLKCNSCGSSSSKMLELKCNHLICENCFSQRAINSLTSTLECPHCNKQVDLFEEKRIFSEFEIDREKLETQRLMRKLYENNEIECGHCKKVKKNYYQYCPHVCKECFAEIVRGSIAPCAYCRDTTDFDTILAEKFHCDDCGISNYFVGSYGKFVNDERNILCIACSYAYYNTGFNENLGLRLRKIDKLELSEHIFRNCNFCKQDKYKGNFKKRSDCQHYICSDCEAEPICKECT